jgi:hypothetical protein
MRKTESCEHHPDVDRCLIVPLQIDLPKSHNPPSGNVKIELGEGEGESQLRRKGADKQPGDVTASQPSEQGAQGDRLGGGISATVDAPHAPMTSSSNAAAAKQDYQQHKDATPTSGYDLDGVSQRDTGGSTAGSGERTEEPIAANKGVTQVMKATSGREDDKPKATEEEKKGFTDANRAVQSQPDMDHPTRTDLGTRPNGVE